VEEEVKFNHDAYDHQRRNLIVSKLPETGTILDVGCGDGFVTKAMEEKGLTVVGIDVEPNPYLIGDFLKHPFDHKAFDMACAFEVLEHVPDPGAIVRKMLDVTRGPLFFTVPVGKEVYHQTHVRFYDGPALEKLMPGCNVFDLGVHRPDGRPLWYWVVWHNA
jgi:2-polyprenyl-3-methyl-5-hydroxy-6-metoxy-1,4-benzoquinol methylase